MLIIIPTRIIPGVLLGGAFAFAGLGTGFAACSLLLDPSSMRVPHFVCPPLFVLALFYLRQVWRNGADPDALSEAAALSPRLMVVLFGLCLLVGLSTGVMIGYTIVHRDMNKGANNALHRTAALLVSRTVQENRIATVAAGRVFPAAAAELGRILLRQM